MAISDLVLRQVEDTEQERQRQIKSAWLAYNGVLPNAIPVTKSDPTGADNVRLNFARLIVDKGVSFLFGNDLEFEIAGEDEQTNTDTAKVDPRLTRLQDIWHDNGWKATLHEMAVYGGVTGDVFVKIKAAVKERDYPRIIILNTEHVTAIWSTEDYKDVMAYRIQWTAIDYSGRIARPIVRRQMIERNEQQTAWTITDWISPGDNPRWTMLGTPEIWPYSWCPIFHCQNLPQPGVFWGLSDLETDVVGLNQSINFVISNMARIIRMHAHPQPVGRGFNAETLNWTPGKLIGLPTKDSDINYLEMSSDLSSSIEIYKRLKEAMHEIARVPEIATGKVDSAGALSGVALKILYQSLIEKTLTKQLMYGQLLEELNSRLLEMDGAGEGIKTELHWPNLLPSDDKSEAETALLYDQIGVSRNTILTRLGFDPEMEEQKKSEESQTAQDMGAALLEQFSKGQMPGQSPGQMPQQMNK